MRGLRESVIQSARAERRPEDWEGKGVEGSSLVESRKRVGDRREEEARSGVNFGGGSGRDLVSFSRATWSPSRIFFAKITSSSALISSSLPIS